jgi:hypothetical protein
MMGVYFAATGLNKVASFGESASSLGEYMVFRI